MFAADKGSAAVIAEAGSHLCDSTQKPSTTASILNGVCGGGKRSRGPALHKGAFLVRSFHQNPDQVRFLYAAF